MIHHINGGVSLLLGWPLLKTSKLLRILVAALIWINNQLVLPFFLQFKGKTNLFGIIFYILYNSLDQNPILSFFTFFLIGTVVGDIIYDFSTVESELERKRVFKRKIIAPLLVTGVVLISASFWNLLPKLFSEQILTIKTNMWWLIYSLGLDLLIILFLLTIEEYNLINTKRSYKSIYYFSYYSLTLFLLQNINFFFFYNLLNKYNIWYFITVTVILYGLLLKFLYKKYGGRASLKARIGRKASKIAGNENITK